MPKLIVLVILMFLPAFSAAAQKQEMAGQSFAGLVERLLPGVVNISTVRRQPENDSAPDIISSNEYIRDYFLQDDGGRTSLGSGFLIDGKGYIITNNHVIDQADEIIVRLSDDRQYNASVVGRDKMTDLALIKIDAEEALPYVKLGNSDDLKVGDWILAIGNPFGLGGSVTAGIVSAKSRDIDAGSYDNFIQTDASINQGSSGGPMFNMDGEVVGINTAIFSSNGGSMGIGFATPVNLSKFVIEQLISKGRVERGWIGVKVVSNSEDIIISEKEVFTGGVVVSALTDKSPAAEAGIEAGDVIMAQNGAPIKNAKEFSRTVAETPIGTSVILRIWRNGLIKDFTLVISPMPESRPIKAAADKAAPVQEKPAGYIEELGVIAEVKDTAVVVGEVLADSDAAAKGVKSGDVISSIDGHEVGSVEDLRSYAAYAAADGGREIRLTVISEGVPQALTIKGTADDAR